jgi:hypothetical protein
MNDNAAGQGPLERPVRPLVWTEPLGPMPGCRYDHVAAQTPFGRFLVTWKGWKDHDWPCVDETPWGDHFGSWPTVAAAKSACEEEFARRLRACFAP